MRVHWFEWEWCNFVACSVDWALTQSFSHFLVSTFSTKFFSLSSLSFKTACNCKLPVEILHLSCVYKRTEKAEEKGRNHERVGQVLGRSQWIIYLKNDRHLTLCMDAVQHPVNTHHNDHKHSHVYCWSIYAEMANKQVRSRETANLGHGTRKRTQLFSQAVLMIVCLWLLY